MPVNYRPILYGVCAMINGPFTILIPIALTKFKMLGVSPFLVFSFMSLIPLIGFKLIPETKGKVVPEMAEEEFDEFRNINENVDNNTKLPNSKTPATTAGSV